MLLRKKEYLLNIEDFVEALRSDSIGSSKINITDREIHFKFGFEDAKYNAGFRKDYDDWNPDLQREYECGRLYFSMNGKIDKNFNYIHALSKVTKENPTTHLPSEK